MPTTSIAVRDVARQMLAIEAGNLTEPETLAPAIESIHVKLREKLSVLIGQEGFAALFRRALHLSRRELPHLGNFVLGAQSSSELHGTLEFIEANSGDQNAVLEGLTAMVGHFIGLLVTFIGEDLSMQILIDIWPELGQPDAARHSEDGGTPSE